MDKEEKEKLAIELSEKAYPYATEIQGRMLKSSFKEGVLVGLDARQPEIDKIYQD
jgi:hypothetical protein